MSTDLGQNSHHSTPFPLRARLCSYFFALMTTGAFSRNVGKLFSELKLVPDNLLFIYAAIDCEQIDH